MRLEEFEIQSIKGSIKKYLPDAEIYLYGSRVDDSKRGGDIDLLIYVDQEVDFQIKSTIYWDICELIGEQKIDMLFTNKGTPNSFVQLISSEAVLL